MSACGPPPPNAKTPAFHQTAEFSPPFFTPKKKNARGEKKKKDHTTSSGKGPFSGPLVCRLLSRPNRVPIHTSRAWCMMHALKRSPSLPPPHGGQSGPAPPSSGRQFSATTQLLGLLKKVGEPPFRLGFWKCLGSPHRRLPTDPSSRPTARRLGANPASHV